MIWSPLSASFIRAKGILASTHPSIFLRFSRSPTPECHVTQIALMYQCNRTPFSQKQSVWIDTAMQPELRKQTGTNVPWRHCFHCYHHRDHHQFIIIVSCTHQARPCDCNAHIWVDSKVTNQTLKVISVEGSTLWGLPEGHLHNFMQVLKVNRHETLDY